jgi:hypothetical protein
MLPFFKICPKIFENFPKYFQTFGADDPVLKMRPNNLKKIFIRFILMYPIFKMCPKILEKISKIWGSCPSSKMPKNFEEIFSNILGLCTILQMCPKIFEKFF